MIDGEDVFVAQRPRLIGLAYRLLGSLSDAEDVVQEAWIRWQRADHDAIDAPAAWLTTVTSRLGLDRLRQRQRVEYVGTWLPEPLVSGADPAQVAELGDSLTTAFLVMLERLTPEERLVLLLADVFQEPFVSVAAVVGKSVDATRQMAVRARRRVRADAASAASATAHAIGAPDRVVADRFVAALMAGDTATVQAMVAADVVMLSDGGRERHAARRPVVGRDRVSRFLINIIGRAVPLLGQGVEFVPTTVNGRAGFVIEAFGEPYMVASFDIVDGMIHRSYGVLNPTKLQVLKRRIELV